MNEFTGQTDTGLSVNYELTLSAEQAVQGVTKLLMRKGKKLQVAVPAGVSTGSVVKLTNALQMTDGRPGDILILIKVKVVEPAKESSIPKGVVEITDGSFTVEVLESKLPVAVDFWAPWCGPCRMMAPIMDQAALQYEGKLKFCKINVDENPLMASQYQAMSIPLLLFFKSGKVIDKIVGAVPEPHLRAKLDALLQP